MGGPHGYTSLAQGDPATADPVQSRLAYLETANLGLVSLAVENRVYAGELRSQVHALSNMLNRIRAEHEELKSRVFYPHSRTPTYSPTPAVLPAVHAGQSPVDPVRAAERTTPKDNVFSRAWDAIPPDSAKGMQAVRPGHVAGSDTRNTRSSGGEVVAPNPRPAVPSRVAQPSSPSLEPGREQTIQEAPAEGSSAASGTPHQSGEYPTAPKHHAM